ncbi:aminotransferase class I/II-fold pyridoxal phosphate-dependent enzyme [Bacillaceae bacterium]
MQERAPLFEALVRHVKGGPTPFHVPGHKMGNAFPCEARAFFQSLLPLDLTEISGLDDLHQPESVIKEAQELAAQAFGAEETHFLVGGSTVGNLALMMTVCQPGDKIIVQRNAHKSVFHGIVLARANPLFVEPRYDRDWQVAAGVEPSRLAEMLAEHPDAKAVFLTDPNYYGIGTDIARIAEICHERDIPLLVDQAHGAHYGFLPELPRSAMQCGADAAVQSTHKMLTAMTMGSMLHVQGTRIDRGRLKRMLTLLQSSSPSYPLLASLDLARKFIVTEGRERLREAIRLAAGGRETIAAQFPWLDVLSPAACRSGATCDPLKLVLHVRGDGWNGYRLQTALEQRRIYPEMADPFNVVLALSPGTKESDFRALTDALAEIGGKRSGKRAAGGNRFGEETEASAEALAEVPFLAFAAPALQMPLHEVWQRPLEQVALDRAPGRICGEFVIPYPPGIPLLLMGETITAAHVDLLKRLRAAGARFQGGGKETPDRLYVVK